MKKEFKTLAEFKRVLQVGDKLNAINHANNVEYPTREVSTKQTNSFALKTQKTDGSFVDSWCEFPPASMCKVESNKLVIYQKDTRNFSGGMDDSNPAYKSLPLIPVITYWFAE